MTKAVKIKIGRSRLDEIVKAVRSLSDNKVKIGIAGEAGSEVVNAALYNEFGTRFIPERSFLRSTFNARQAAYIKALQKAVDVVSAGKMTSEAAMNQIGLRMVADIQKTIDDTSTPPLAESTIEAKGSSKPLIDTGRLRASITYELTDGKENK